MNRIFLPAFAFSLGLLSPLTQAYECKSPEERHKEKAAKYEVTKPPSMMSECGIGGLFQGGVDFLSGVDWANGDAVCDLMRDGAERLDQMYQDKVLGGAQDALNMGEGELNDWLGMVGAESQGGGGWSGLNDGEGVGQEADQVWREYIVPNTTITPDGRSDDEASRWRDGVLENLTN